MASTLLSDPVLDRFRTVLDQIYGDRTARVVLFGSRARGDVRPDSDWDIAVFLKEPMETEALRLADAGIDILLDTGAVINSMRLPAGSWDDRTGFMGEIRREGIMGIGLHRAAARSAYYAAFHAAEALIHARTGRAAKTHAGCAEPVRAAGPAGDGHRG